MIWYVISLLWWLSYRQEEINKGGLRGRRFGKYRF